MGTIWHVPSCQKLTRVLFIDVEAAEVGQAPDPFQIANDQIVPTITRYKKITMHSTARPSWYLWLLDPIDDGEDLRVSAADAVILRAMGHSLVVPI